MRSRLAGGVCRSSFSIPKKSIKDSKHMILFFRRQALQFLYPANGPFIERTSGGIIHQVI
jgi:hypothetical protein